MDIHRYLERIHYHGSLGTVGDLTEETVKNDIELGQGT